MVSVHGRMRACVDGIYMCSAACGADERGHEGTGSGGSHYTLLQWLKRIQLSSIVGCWQLCSSCANN